MNAATTPRARLIPPTATGYMNGLGCNLHEPERDRPGIRAVCPQTATKVAAHTTVDVQHGPMCERHAREQLSKCFAGTCTRLRWNGSAYVEEPTPR